MFHSTNLYTSHFPFISYAALHHLYPLWWNTLKEHHSLIFFPSIILNSYMNGLKIFKPSPFSFPHILYLHTFSESLFYKYIEVRATRRTTHTIYTHSVYDYTHTFEELIKYSVHRNLNAVCARIFKYSFVMLRQGIAKRISLKLTRSMVEWFEYGRFDGYGCQR